MLVNLPFEQEIFAIAKGLYGHVIKEAILTHLRGIIVPETGKHNFTTTKTEGSIELIYENSALRVHFGNTHNFYTLDGRYSIKDKERVLAYTDPKTSKVLVFPKDILDLDRLPKGTPILIEQMERTILHPGKVCYIALFEENVRTWSTGNLSSELFSSYFSKLISSAEEEKARNFHGVVKLYSPEMDF